MFADDKTVLAAYDRWIKPLVVVGVLEQAINMYAGLVSERPFANNALLPRHRPAGGFCHKLGYRWKPLQIDSCLDSKTTTKPHYHLFKWSISGALAKAIDRGVDVRGASPDSRQGVRRG